MTREELIEAIIESASFYPEPTAREYELDSRWRKKWIGAASVGRKGRLPNRIRYNDANYTAMVTAPKRTHPGAKKWKQAWHLGTVQFSNANLFLILGVLGLPEDYSGSVPNEELPALLRKIMVIKNSSRSKLAQHERPSYHSQSPVTRTVTHGEDGVSRIGTQGGAHMYSMGADSNYILRRLTDLEKLIKLCIKNGWGLYWA